MARLEARSTIVELTQGVNIVALIAGKVAMSTEGLFGVLAGRVAVLSTGVVILLNARVTIVEVGWSVIFRLAGRVMFVPLTEGVLNS